MQAAAASGGQAALDWLAANPKPALVLLDLIMPKMDGFAFLEHLQQHPELADLPVVILTAKELTDNERSFLAERTLLVLTKGAQPISKLGYALAAIANRSRKPRHQGAADGKME
jgi:CheY-like chemotaxis protein